MVQKYFGRERVCASMIDTKIKGKSLNIGAGQVKWIENDLFVGKKDFISLDIDERNLHDNNLAITKVVGDATDLPFKNGELSQIIILDVLEHIKDHEKALEEIHRTLKKGGKLVICVPNDTYLSYVNPVRYVQHERHYTINQITSLLRKHGFKIEKFFAGGRVMDLAGLYIHFLIKYTTGRIINADIVNKFRDMEYRKHNNSGNEIAIKASKK